MRYINPRYLLTYVLPVLAPRFIFVSGPVSLYTVTERVKSRFHKDHTKRDENSL